MEGIFYLLITIIGMCFLFGVVYPLCMILVYPFYRLFGGRKSFLNYLSDL